MQEAAVREHRPTAEELRLGSHKIAAHLLEASPDDIEFAEGKWFVRGSPDRAKAFGEIALAAYLAGGYLPARERAPEERTELGRGDEVAFGAELARRARVVAQARLVQHQLHVARERNPAAMVRDVLGEAGEGIAKFLGQGEGLAVMGFGRLTLLRLALRGDGPGAGARFDNDASWPDSTDRLTCQHLCLRPGDENPGPDRNVQVTKSHNPEQQLQRVPLLTPLQKRFEPVCSLEVQCGVGLQDLARSPPSCDVA